MATDEARLKLEQAPGRLAAAAASLRDVARRDVRTCPKCKTEKDISEFIEKRGAASKSAGQKPQLLCKPCKNAIDRIGRLGEKGFVKVDDMIDLTEEEKAETMQKAHNLTGQSLAACITSAIHQSRTRIHKRKFQCQEAFMSEEQMKIEFKTQPQRLKELLATPEELCFVCDQTKMKMIPVPTYTRSTSNEEEHEERRERVIEMNQNVKAPKAEAKAKGGPKRPRLTEKGERKFHH